ncbi:MAG: hypothetical protein V1695_02635 [Candidatus Uhrbacteria bacterium]
MQKIKISGLTIVIALVFLGTIFVLFSNQPEQRVTYSEDGQVRLEYLAEAGRYLQVDTLPPSLGQAELRRTGAGVIPTYTIDPNDYVFTQPATLFFHYDLASPEIYIAGFDQETEEWQILATEYDREKAELSTQVDQVAQWTLIQYTQQYNFE